MRPLVLSVAAVIVFGAPFPLQPAAAQTVRYVDDIRSCDGLIPCYATITAAVDAAAAGDTIEVFVGVYEENVSVSGPSKGRLVLRAHDPALKPVIAALSGDAVTIFSPQIQLLDFVIEAANGTGVAVVSGFSGGYLIQGNRIKARFGIRINSTAGGSVTSNAFLGGGLSGDAATTRIEANTFVDAGILLFELLQRPNLNLIQHNVLRRGRIDVGRGSGNTIASNFVSGNSGDGIAVGVRQLLTSNNVIEDNTSIENGGCDINDRGIGGNTWSGNRFGTRCGAAAE